MGRPDLTEAFLEVISLVRARATLWGTIQAAGRWGVSFPRRHDLLFFRVDYGSCQFVRAGSGAVGLKTGDILLVGTSASFRLTSDPEAQAQAVDSWKLVAATGSREMRLGQGDEAPVLLRGGRLVFDATMERLLVDFLPSFVHVTPPAPSWERVRALLAMNEAAAATDGVQSRFVVPRLMELLLAELQCGEAVVAKLGRGGIRPALTDSMATKALAALHGDIARKWTTAELARLCGKSRSGFSARFSQTVGIGPMAYIQHWRMAVAKDQLRTGRRSVTEIAYLVGFQSSSAFITAFTRENGCSPTRWKRRATDLDQDD
ncbi:AraC family transcriptional regulator (plasmid) [Lichenicola cladoniae]|uniref:AraC family transcriptional regulator n=1 Tax=Lichenicola cladoniae TaxID=1484109 RepID=A0A6M8HYN4_9PROT|nr:AraC family transcriptional regulator [Lichenicola cladoniae]NPD69351.1 AraC family transcriptional regulator [Acetobacteraceae bacterium]QKE93659.1 AraC family transcriptional regulator [Lichenicola cladoniae]